MKFAKHLIIQPMHDSAENSPAPADIIGELVQASLLCLPH